MAADGRVTIPADVRETLGLRPGDLIFFEQAAGSIRMVKGAEGERPSFADRLARARAQAAPLPLGMTADAYMACIREPLPPPEA